MSRHDPKVSLRQMLDFSNDAMTIANGKRREDLDQMVQLRYSLIYLLGAIGEAAKRIPLEIQREYPQIEWPRIISVRNRFIHGYDKINFDILWQIVTEDLPVLSAELEKMIESES